MITIEMVEAEIRDIVLNGEEYPTAMQLAESVVGTNQFKLPLYLRALNNLDEQGEIMYDDKHDSWIYTKPSEKMKEMLDKYVSIL